MSDSPPTPDQVTAALNWFDEQSGNFRNDHVLAAAARDWLRIQEAETIWWCETHHGHGLQYCWRAAFTDPVPADAKPRCRMVERRLI